MSEPQIEVLICSAEWRGDGKDLPDLLRAAGDWIAANPSRFVINVVVVPHNSYGDKASVTVYYTEGR